MKSYLDVSSLPVQMILSFIAVVILTAAAVGIPAIWLIHEQLDRQAWSQVDQGRHAAIALYDAKTSEIKSLAVLSAQRPTLREYLEQDDRDALGNYLETLMTGAGLDLVVVCSATDETIASTVEAMSVDPCSSWRDGTYQVLDTGPHPEVWLTASYPVESAGGSTSEVLVAQNLDNEFTSELLDKTGLEHTIWAGGLPAATSFVTGIEHLETLSPQSTGPNEDEGFIRSTYTFAGQPYYSLRTALAPNGIELEAALSVAENTSTQNWLVWIMAAGILVVAVMGSTIGVFLSRRISKPLVHLADTAEDFRKGDLSSSIAVDAQVREVAQVSQALEAARIDLQSTLTNLEKEKAWVNHLLESIVEGIITLDAEGRITYFSQGASRITGWRPDDVIGSSCDEIFHLPETQKTFSENIQDIDSRRKLIVELSDGHHATLAVTRARLAPLEAGDAQTVLVFRDVSEGEIIHRILGNFLANIAHEFRTPLSAAGASIELLIDQAPDLSDTELQELLNSLHLGVLGLQTLVDNLLECASIEAGRFHVSPRSNDIAEIISIAVQTLQPLLEKYGQRLLVELPANIPVVYADARRVEQVLVNLLYNASKFGPADAEITIGVVVDQMWAKVLVADRGPGISHEQKSFVFRRIMYPDTSSDSAKVGAGLGLSVVKAVIEAHGGQVGVDDRPGGGAVFWFTLPLENEG